MNTADTGRLTASSDGTTIVTDVNITGSGIVNLEAAVDAPAVLSPVSVSFGSTPSGSGVTRSVTVTVLNGGTVAATWPVAITDLAASGVTFKTSVASVTLDPGTSTTITVTATFSKAAAKGNKQASLVIGDPATPVAHAVVYAFVK